MFIYIKSICEKRFVPDPMIPLYLCFDEFGFPLLKIYLSPFFITHTTVFFVIQNAIRAYKLFEEILIDVNSYVMYRKIIYNCYNHLETVATREISHYLTFL